LPNLSDQVVQGVKEGNTVTLTDYLHVALSPVPVRTADKKPPGSSEEPQFE
jgi:hypothetical protein